MGLPQQRLTLQAFLDWENIQPERHEFYRGEVFAMTGGRRSHGCVTANLVRHLGNQLEGTPCRVFSESMKIQIDDDTILYPDTRRAEAFRINADGLFVLFDTSESEILELDSINCRVAIAEVFAGIDISG